MTFDKRTMALISVGASVAANCLPCLQYHSGKAREAGLTEEEIHAAAEVGKSIRKGAANHMDQLIARLGGQSTATQPGCGSGCNC